MSNFGEGLGGTIGLLALVVGGGLLLFFLKGRKRKDDDGASMDAIEEAIEDMQAEVEPGPEELDEAVGEEHYY